MGQGGRSSLEATIPADAAVARARGAQGGLAAPERARSQRIDRYLIVDELGRGGMGIVYAAYDPELDRKVAIKLLLGERSDADGRARLLREAQAMARLSHPNVVHVHDVGATEAGEVFVAMEYIEGQTLGDWLEAAPRGVDAILAILREAGQGLIAAHAVGLIHRDFKPDNVLLDHEGRAKISDFGLARAAGEGGDEASPTVEVDRDVAASISANATAASVVLTRTGAVLGTPAYMAPEQHLGQAADARSDQYSFCVTLFEALYGRRPFRGATLGELCMRVLGGELEAPSSARVPRWIFPIVARGLHRDPDARWPSMAALLAALSRDPVRSRRRWLAAGVAAIAIVGAVVGAQRWRAAEEAAARERCAAPEVEVGERFAAARPEVRAAILGTAAPTAARASARVDEVLEAFAADWRAAHAETCAAAGPGGELSPEIRGLREICLDRQLAAGLAVVDTIKDADAKVVGRIDDLLRVLPDPRRCVELSYLARLRVDDPAASGDGRGEALVRELARVRAVAYAGRYQDAKSRLEALSAAAEALGSRPILAQVRGLEARVASYLGELGEAEEAYLRGLGDALASESDYEAAAIATALIYFYGYFLSDWRSAERWITISAGLIDRVGDDDLRLQHLNYVGAARSQASDYEAALASYDEAARLAGRQGVSPRERASIDNNRAVILNYLGRQTDAKSAYYAALDAMTRELGEDHHDVAMTRNGLGTMLLADGDLEGALDQFERALVAQERSLGADNPMIALTLINLGSTYVETEDFARAVALGERALAVLERSGVGGEHIFVGYAALLLGDAHGRAREGEAAKAASARALRILEAHLGAEHPHVGASLVALSTAQLELGDVPGASATFARAAPLIASSREFGDADQARMKLLEARLLAARGDRAEAATIGRSALASLAALPSAYAGRRARIEAWIRALAEAEAPASEQGN